MIKAGDSSREKVVGGRNELGTEARSGLLVTWIHFQVMIAWLGYSGGFVIYHNFGVRKCLHRTSILDITEDKQNTNKVLSSTITSALMFAVYNEYQDHDYSKTISNVLQERFRTILGGTELKRPVIFNPQLVKGYDRTREWSRKDESSSTLKDSTLVDNIEKEKPQAESCFQRSSRVIH